MQAAEQSTECSTITEQTVSPSLELAISLGAADIQRTVAIFSPGLLTIHTLSGKIPAHLTQRGGGGGGGAIPIRGWWSGWVLSTMGGWFLCCRGGIKVETRLA